MSRLCIVDASVLLKWVLPPDDEPWSAQAIALFTAARQGVIEPRAPTLWWYETGNILARKYPNQAADYLVAVAAILGDGHPMSDPALRTLTFELTARYPVTFYDASYHALAIALQGTFITADEKYLATAGDAGHILHLKDFR